MDRFLIRRLRTSPRPVSSQMSFKCLVTYLRATPFMSQQKRRYSSTVISMYSGGSSGR